MVDMAPNYNNLPRRPIPTIINVTLITPNSATTTMISEHNDHRTFSKNSHNPLSDDNIFKKVQELNNNKNRHTYRSPKLPLTSANTTKTKTYTDRNNPENRYKLRKRRKVCYQEYDEEMTDDIKFLMYQSNSKKQYKPQGCAVPPVF